MEGILKSDIFFFITAVAVVIFAVAALVVFIYIIRILRDVKKFSSRVREEGEHLTQDVHDLHHNVRAQGKKAKDLSNLVVKTVTQKVKKATRRKKKSS